jgi:ligand-binding sensor domain-containing protein/serine/threonine protein kinase
MGKSSFNLIFVALLLIALQSSVALALDPNKSITQYAHEVWQDELPQNTILTIKQTRNGYIWFGTYEGLVRFDGIRFTVFDKRSTKEIENNAVFVVYEDSKGTLWIGTNGGLNCLKDGKFSIYRTKEGLSNNSIKAVLEDRAGNIWIGTERGLDRFRDGKFTAYSTQNGLSNDSIRTIYEDKKGNLWLGTHGGLNCFKDGKFTSYTTKEGLPNDGVRSLFEDEEGNLWIGTNGGGFCSFKDGKFTTYNTKSGLSNDFVYPLIKDRDGNFWIGTNGGGINRFKDGKFTSYTSKDGLSNDFVRAIYEDREGNIWIGTNGGLNCLKDRKFTSYTTREGLSNDNVRVTYQDREGGIWIGTDGGGVCRFKDGEFTVYGIKEGLPNDNIRSLVEDREGNIWIGTNGDGLCRLRNGKITTFSSKDGLSNDFVYALYEDRDGNLWIGTTGGGLNRYKDGKFTVYTVKDGLSNNSVRAIHQDRSGNLWLATAGGGLSLLKEGKFINFTNKDGLSNDFVLALYEDKEGDLWIGTNGGINRYRNGKFTVYTSKDGLFDDTAFQILEDGKGNLWMSCNRGVYRVSKKELDDFDKGIIKTINCIAYGKVDGLGANQCNGASQPSGLRTSDGRLWFPTIGGLSSIDPENIKLNGLAPAVLIDEIIIDNQSISFSDQIALSPGKQKFEFHYTGLSYLAPGKVGFKYMLEGFDREWVDAGTRRTAYYTNIPPGSYKFKVLACNNDGVWNELGASIGFQLPPPLWRTWWAYLLYALSIAGAGYGGVKLRLQALQRRTEILEGKVAERTAELDKKNEELAQKMEQLRISHKETEEKNDQLARKNEELAKKNDELVESYKKADRIFSALTDALPGTVLDGKYRLEVKIGSGGYGAVYRAAHLGLNRFVAVKVFKPSSGNDSAEGLERFRLEGISTCRVNHPNAISVLDSGISAEGIAYLVMELLQGHSLAEELREDEKLSVRRSVEILIPVCGVLAQAHRSGIVHRDIKPDNIFLHQTKDEEVVKVLDFGIAKLLDEESGDALKLTGAGGIIGTLTYMSPERLSKGPYDGRSDIYSLGIMMYEMMCGRVPFDPDWDGLAAVVLMHLKNDPDPPRNINPDIPDAVEALILRALTKDPNKRPTAEELGQDLKEILVTLPVSESDAGRRTKIYKDIGTESDIGTSAFEFNKTSASQVKMTDQNVSRTAINSKEE